MTVDSKKKKEIIALSVLGVVAAYLVYTNLLAGPSTPSSERPRAAATAADGGPVTMVGAVPKKAAPKNVRTSGRDRDAFHPLWLSPRPEERPRVETIDPTLHWEMLAKVQDVAAAGGKRNLFVFGVPPPPKPVELPKQEPVVKIAQGGPGQAGRGGILGAAPPPKNDSAPPEKILQVPLKYYGIIAYSRSGNKTACFMDGDEVLTASEGDTLKRRYRVVRIGDKSVVMEDTDSKLQGTLPIAPEAQG